MRLSILPILLFQKIAIVSCIFTLSFAGCGKQGLTTIPVQGQVTFKGNPLTNAEIAFHPSKLYADGPNRIAVGKLDAEGRYKLSTVTHGDGIQPGEYGVVIVPREGGRVIDAGENEPVSQIPRMYSLISTTPLKATIPADASGGMQFDFELKEQ
jgi:hypothetical protein